MMVVCKCVEKVGDILIKFSKIVFIKECRTVVRPKEDIRGLNFADTPYLSACDHLLWSSYIICMFVCVCVCVYIYIYIYRERERASIIKEIQTMKVTLKIY